MRDTVTDRWLYAWAGANVAIGALSLLVPLFIVGLGGTAFDLGVCWFATSTAMVPGALGVGTLVDRTGRYRPFALAGLGGLALATAVLPFLDTVAAVIVVDAALWLCVASATPVFTTLVLADAPEREWNARIARLNRYQGYGWTGGLVLGALWTRLAGSVLAPLATSSLALPGGIALGPVSLPAQRSLLLVCVALLTGATLAAARWLPSSDVTTSAGTLARRPRLLGTVRGALSPLLPGRLVTLARTSSPRALLRGVRRPLAIYLAAVSVFFAGFSVFSAPLPDFLAGVGFGDDAVYALYVVSSLSSAAFYAGAGALADRYDLRRLQTGALGFRALAFPAVAAAASVLGAPSITSLLGVAALNVVVGLSWAVVAITANTLVARYAAPGRRGAALGLYTALSSGAGGIGGLVGGWLAARTDYLLTFGVAGALVLVGGLGVFALGWLADTGRGTSAPSA
ncbi:MFS transporter [Halarchaeum salinum]|uniref:Major facilitator superfamily (MFS) profile domain-containing protein n=1 Tax=Halarchaeum salinum TaxID=489912 RepID=A0AAV3S6G8_9EURY